MIETIEIAPNIYVDKLVDVVADELYDSIWLEGDDTRYVFMGIDRSKLREAFLKVLLARTV